MGWIKMGESQPVKYWGERIYKYSCVTSTNNIAKDFAGAGEGDGSVIWALEQSGGRGRWERFWFSPPGGLWFSLILRPPVQNLEGITLLFSLWVIQFLEETLLKPLHLCWPNDIYMRGKKMGGILAETKTRDTRIEWLVMGIGINVNNAQFPQDLNATSIFLEKETCLDIECTLKELLHFMEQKYRSYLKLGFISFLPEITEHCPMIGKEVEIAYYRGTHRMKVMAIGEKGQLITLNRDNHREEITSAEKVTLMLPSI